jgi:hypothetical protein
MNNVIEFGRFDVPYLNSEGMVSYIAPSILPKEMMAKASFEEIKPTALVEDEEQEDEEDEVTHRVFFGENIKRALRILHNGD